MRRLLWGWTIGLGVLSLAVWRLQPAPDADGRREVVWVSDDNPTRQAQLAVFERQDPRFRVTLDPDNQGVEKVIVQCLAGVGPDLVDAYTAFDIAAYVKSGVVVDLTDELPKLGIDVKSQTFPGIQGAAIYDGRVYGVPADLSVDGIWIHRDLFRQAGIQEPHGPWSWEQLAELAQKLTVRDAEGRIVRYGLLFDWNWKVFFATYGARVFSPDGKSCLLDRPEAIRAIAMMHDLAYKYRVTPTAVEQASMAGQGGWGSGSIAWFGAKRGAMALGGRWWLASLRSYPGLDLGVIECPNGGFRRFFGYGRATLLTKQAKNREGALGFLKCLATAEYNREVNQDADGVGGFRKFVTDADLAYDPAHPAE
ncbi:MAG TPA: extracellular solute-binding protein, partial [Fimbriimonadaceae bacterium]|nr:extracellular solute-binding protein [Fimbriimonadaceae bacterium]